MERRLLGTTRDKIEWYDIVLAWRIKTHDFNLKEYYPPTVPENNNSSSDPSRKQRADKAIMERDQEDRKLFRTTRPSSDDDDNNFRSTSIGNGQVYLIANAVGMGSNLSDIHLDAIDTMWTLSQLGNSLTRNQRELLADVL
jgi:hypothetical protein